MTRLLIDNISDDADFGRIVSHLNKMLPNLRVYQIADEKAPLTSSVLMEC